MFYVKVLLMAVLFGTISARYTNDNVVEPFQFHNSQGLMIALNKADTNILLYYCGAVLIQKHLLLTLADCFGDNDNVYGGVAGFPVMETAVHEISVVRTIYDKFDKNKYMNNIGLMIFAKDMTNEGEYKIAPLIEADAKLHHGKLLYVNGYGIINGKHEYKPKDGTVMTTVKRKSLTNGCVKKYNSGRVNEQTICAVLNPEYLDCLADHGGPMYISVNIVAALAIHNNDENCKEDKPLLSIALTDRNINKWLHSFYD